MYCAHEHLTKNEIMAGATGMLVPTSARVYQSNVGMLYLKVLSANIGLSLLLKY